MCNCCSIGGVLSSSWGVRWLQMGAACGVCLASQLPLTATWTTEPEASCWFASRKQPTWFRCDSTVNKPVALFVLSSADISDSRSARSSAR